MLQPEAIPQHGCGTELPETDVLSVVPEAVDRMPRDKLWHAVREAATVTQKVIVGVSGGKDSVALLDICCKTFKSVYPFFMYIVKGLGFQEKYLSVLEHRYGVKFLRIPHWQLSTMYQSGAYRPDNALAMSTPTIKMGDVENYVRDYFQCGWIAYGMMKCESLERNAMIGRSGAVDYDLKKIYPLAEWSPGKVKDYLALNQIPLAPEYRYMKRSFGSLLPECLEMVKDHFPDDYEKIKYIFPYIEAHEARRRYVKQKRKLDESAE